MLWRWRRRSWGHWPVRAPRGAQPTAKDICCTGRGGDNSREHERCRDHNGQLQLQEPTGPGIYSRRRRNHHAVQCPGASQAQPIAINASGTVAGSYCDSAGCHGFVRTADGTISSFDVPSALGFVVVGIDGAGRVPDSILTNRTAKAPDFCGMLTELRHIRRRRFQGFTTNCRQPGHCDQRSLV